MLILKASTLWRRAERALDSRTVHSLHTMLNRAFRDAVTSRYITENPVTLATRVRQPRKAHDVWTADELRRFLAEAKRNACTRCG